MPEPAIKILLIGPPIVTRDGKPIKITRRQHRALLYYLASRPHPVSREQLCELFWPDEAEEKARKNLREALSCLRRALVTENALVAADNQVSLNPELVSCDLRDFVREMGPLLSSAEMKSTGPLPEAMAQHFRTQLRVGRTNQFLQGMNLSDLVEFENWRELTSQSYNYTRAMVLDRLIDHYITNGDLDEAMVWLEKGVEINPLDADLNYLILSCMKDTGKFSELIAYVDYLEGLYRQNNESLPARFAELREKTRIIKNSPEQEHSEGWVAAVSGEVKFFGRKKELEELNKAYYRRGIVHLVGDAGTGKTRVLKEFYNQQAYAPRLLHMTAHPFAVNVPFRTIIDGITRTVRDEDWLLLSQEDRDLLNHFVGTYLRDWEKLRDLENDQKPLPMLEEVFHASMRLLEKIALGRPLLCIIDDACWLDKASLSLLGFLIEKRFFKNNGLLIIVTRWEIENDQLVQLISHLKRIKRIETIPVDNFTKLETEQFIQHLTGSKCHADLLQQFQLNTGGNPYYLIECVQEVKRTDLDIFSAPGQMECPIPGVIETEVAEKTRLFEPFTIKTLNAAAVLGNSFTADVLELMVDHKDEQFLDALELLKVKGFLQVDMDILPGGGYCFTHDIERQLIVSRLDPARKRHLSLKAARAILKRKGKKTEQAADVATHFENANEPDQAMQYWLIAAHLARARSDRDATYKAYHSILRLFSWYPHQFFTELIYQAVTEFSVFLLEQDDIPAGEQVYQTCQELGEKRNDALLLGTALSGLGTIAGRKYDFENCGQLFHKAVFHLKEAGHPGELTETYSRIGILAFMFDDYLGAQQALEEGLKIQQEIPAEHALDAATLEARINIFTRLCIILCYMGYPKRAFDLAQRMVEGSRQVPRETAILQANTILALTHYYCGDLQEAINLCLSIRGLAERYNIHFWQSLLDIILGRSYLTLGNLDKAWVHINLAIDREKDDPYGKLFDQARFSKGDIYHAGGDFKNAIQMYRLVIETGFVNYQTIEAMHHLGLNQIYLGQVSEGVKNINKSIALAKEKGLTGSEYSARHTRFILQESAQPAESNQDLKLMLEDMRERGMMFAEVYAALLHAKSAEIDGDTASALKEFKTAAENARTAGVIWFEYYALSRVVQLSGRKNLDGIKSRERLGQIVETLAGNARTPAARIIFRKFPKPV